MQGVLAILIVLGLAGGCGDPVGTIDLGKCKNVPEGPQYFSYLTQVKVTRPWLAPPGDEGLWAIQWDFQGGNQGWTLAEENGAPRQTRSTEYAIIKWDNAAGSLPVHHPQGQLSFRLVWLGTGTGFLTDRDTADIMVGGTSVMGVNHNAQSLTADGRSWKEDIYQSSRCR